MEKNDSRMQLGDLDFTEVLVPKYSISQIALDREVLDELILTDRLWEYDENVKALIDKARITFLQSKEHMELNMRVRIFSTNIKSFVVRNQNVYDYHNHHR